MSPATFVLRDEPRQSFMTTVLTCTSERLSQATLSSMDAYIAFPDASTAAIVACCVERGLTKEFTIHEHAIGDDALGTWTYIPAAASPMTDFWAKAAGEEERV